MPVRRVFLILLFILPAVLILAARVWSPAWYGFILLGPLLLLGLYDMLQTRRALLRVYPVIGHLRYLLEAFRPEIQQYFVETNTEGMPFSREFRSVVYQRAKGQLDTTPFGTQHNVNAVGYEWMNHSLNATPAPEHEPRIRFGGPQCTQPYEASHLNISAMSYGSLSHAAIESLNLGAKLGGFFHNTGEGSISSYHEKHGGDLCWQIGTGYFGCRTHDGHFDPALFEKNAKRDQVKLIEIKLSQGAKPGHGGILPAAKVTPEIAAIRNVPLGQDVLSPPSHNAFNSPKGLLEFVAKLRDLSGGKPVGFKLCIGRREEFLAVCKAMVETGIAPDFITIDGGEGGTGAAPVELSNSVGMPLREGLSFVDNALRLTGLRDQIRLIAAGKVITGFHVLRLLALGADTVNAGRAFMLSLGCIQARRCHDNGCPVGVATQDPSRVIGLDVTDKSKRVQRYHHNTIEAMMELLGVAGLQSPDEIRREYIQRRVEANQLQTYAQIYPEFPVAALLEDPTSLPAPWARQWAEVSAEHF